MIEARSEEAFPLVSVIVPVYNAERFLRPCLDSIKIQTLKSIEVICVDDGSTDRSLAILDEYACEDSRFAVYSQNNSGAAAARNLALSRSKGDYLFFVDSDDYIPNRNALERLYAAVMENGVKIAGGSMCFDRDGRLDYDSMHRDDLDKFQSEKIVSYSDYQYDYDFTRFLYSRKMIVEANISFPVRRQFEDPVFHVHAMIEAGRFATIPDYVYAYRRFNGEGRSVSMWSAAEVLDRLAGIEDLLRLSSKNGLAKLHDYVLEQLEYETTDMFLAHVGDEKVMSALFRVNSEIDCHLLTQVRPDFSSSFYVIEPLDIICDGYRKYRTIRENPIFNILAKVKRVLNL